MPRWVKIFGSVLIAMVVLLVLILAGGEHGPAAHMSSHVEGLSTFRFDLHPVGSFIVGQALQILL